MTDNQRGTGRTIRAVTYALIEAAKGKRVAYVVQHTAMALYVRHLAKELCQGQPPATFEVTTFARIARLHYAGTRTKFVTDHFYDTTDPNVWRAVDWMTAHEGRG